MAFMPHRAISLLPLTGFLFLQMALLKEYVGFLSCLNNFPEGIFSVTIVALALNINELIGG